MGRSVTQEKFCRLPFGFSSQYSKKFTSSSRLASFSGTPFRYGCHCRSNTPHFLKNFHNFAAAGVLELRHAMRHHPNIEMFSVPEILEGKLFQTLTLMGKTETGLKDWRT